MIAELVRKHFRLNPSGIISYLNLRRPSTERRPAEATSAVRSRSLPGKDRQGAVFASSKFIRPINDSLRAAVSTLGSPSRPRCEDVPERS